MNIIEIISYWVELKKLIKKSNIHADMQVELINRCLYQKLKEELN